MGCTGDFLPKIELRRYDAGCEFVAQSANHSQAVELSGRRAGDHDHTIEMPLNARFIQQRDVDAKPLFPCFRFRKQTHPTLPNARMKDRLERTARFFMAKDDGSEPDAIDRDVVGKDCIAKAIPHCIAD